MSPSVSKERVQGWKFARQSVTVVKRQGEDIENRSWSAHWAKPAPEPPGRFAHAHSTLGACARLARERARSRAGLSSTSPRSLSTRVSWSRGSGSGQWAAGGGRAGGRQDAGDAEERRACRGGAREAEKVAAAQSPVACSQPPEVAVVNFTL